MTKITYAVTVYADDQKTYAVTAYAEFISGRETLKPYAVTVYADNQNRMQCLSMRMTKITCAVTVYADFISGRETLKPHDGKCKCSTDLKQFIR